MQLKNNYDIEWYRDDGTDGIGAFNGDVGEVYEINRSAELIAVRFDDRIATYNSDMFDQLELAYAVTVHKSQGSEFDIVILNLLEPNPKLYFRNLLYTAVTRAKKILLIVGSEHVVQKMVNNNKQTNRFSGLRYLLEAGI